MSLPHIGAIETPKLIDLSPTSQSDAEAYPDAGDTAALGFGATSDKIAALYFATADAQEWYLLCSPAKTKRKSS